MDSVCHAKWARYLSISFFRYLSASTSTSTYTPTCTITSTSALSHFAGLADNDNKAVRDMN